MLVEVLCDYGFNMCSDFEVFELSGCECCNDMGYCGWVGIFEVLFFSD